MASEIHCDRCYVLFSPFVGQEQAAALAAHPCCSQQPKNSQSPKGLSKTQKQRKQIATKLSKRRKTFMKRAHELQRDCDIDVYVVVRNRKNHQLWEYSNGYLPPPREELETIFPIPIFLNPRSFDKIEHTGNNPRETSPDRPADNRTALESRD